MQTKHVMFDLDGTLLDSEGLMRDAWALCSEEFGLNRSFEEYKAHIGLPFDNILENLGIDRNFDEIKKTYFRYTASHATSTPFFTGATDFIKKIESHGINWSIITAKPRENTILLLDNAKLSPMFLHCGSEGGFHKPNERITEKILKLTGFTDSKCSLVYFGDMIVDFCFAINSEIRYIHCNFGTHGPLDDLLFPKCESINSWMDAPDLI